jgi:hypothetical protein
VNSSAYKIIKRLEKEKKVEKDGKNIKYIEEK